ncbi:MAG: tRNA(Ile)-lysidine synthase, partial [Spartobacteria bacterium]|nr:tRNA(Ile)-lysidine synthase [Spartobacteria bacterium]
MKAFGDPKRLHRAFPASGRYLVGVSGGRDSVALLHWLVQGGYDNLVVCHLNHCLRGRSSYADARFVEKLASRSGLPFETASADVRAIAAKEKMSIETAAR